MLPDGTLHFTSERLGGSKKAKDRMTVVPLTNWTGTDKPPLLCIGTSLNPRAFRSANGRQVQLRVQWKANKKGWMTTALFEAYVKEFNDRMRRLNRKVLLMVDNVSSHSIDNLNLSNVEVAFHPPNTTATTQPLDQGIIQNLKSHYRFLMMSHIISYLDSKEAEGQQQLTAPILAKQLSILDGVNYIADAWDRVVRPTISNCFDRAYLKNAKVVSSQFPVIDPVEPPSGVSAEEFKAAVEIDAEDEAVEELTDAEIVSMVSHNVGAPELLDEKNDGGDDDEPAPTITSAEATECLSRVRLFFMMNPQLLPSLPLLTGARDSLQRFVCTERVARARNGDIRTFFSRPDSASAVAPALAPSVAVLSPSARSTNSGMLVRNGNSDHYVCVVQTLGRMTWRSSALCIPSSTAMCPSPCPDHTRHNQ
jgi:hypothetical protein